MHSMVENTLHSCKVNTIVEISHSTFFVVVTF
jgi:hypothetical protein